MINDQIKSYNALSDEEIKKLFIFSTHFQPLGFYEDIQNMKNYLGGPLLGYGVQHLSIWSEGEVLASVGWIDKELLNHKILYLTHGFSKETSGVYWELLVAEMLKNVKLTYPGIYGELLTLKLGIRGSGVNKAEDWAWVRGWESLYQMLSLSKKLTQGSPILYQNPLQLIEVDQYLWPAFMRIHNAGFKQVPNGGMIDDGDQDEMLQASRNLNPNLYLLYDNGLPVAIAILKPDNATNAVELEAIAVDPDFHGKGYGRRALKTVINHLMHHEQVVRQLNLKVMDSNTRAYQLYISEGFTVEAIEVKWYGFTVNI